MKKMLHFQQKCLDMSVFKRTKSQIYPQSQYKPKYDEIPGFIKQPNIQTFTETFIFTENVL